MRGLRIAIVLISLIIIDIFIGSSSAQAIVLDVGGGVGLNNYSVYNMAIGLTLQADVELASIFAIGAREVLSYDIDNFGLGGLDEWYTTSELSGYFRWYPVHTARWQIDYDFLVWMLPYLQVNVGNLILLDADKTYTSFMISGQIGVKFQSFSSFYFEPYVRYGFPVKLGFGMLFGARIEPDHRSPYSSSYFF